MFANHPLVYLMLKACKTFCNIKGCGEINWKYNTRALTHIDQKMSFFWLAISILLVNDGFNEKDRF